MRIKAVAFDVGGTLMPDDSYSISESVASGLRSIEKHGIYLIFVSRFSNEDLAEIAHKIGINPIIVSTRNDKWEALSKVLGNKAIDPEETVAVGDSDSDMTMLANVGFGIVVGGKFRRVEIITMMPECKEKLTDMNIEDAITYLLGLIDKYS